MRAMVLCLLLRYRFVSRFFVDAWIDDCCLLVVSPMLVHVCFCHRCFVSVCLVSRFFVDAWIDDCCVLMIVCVSPGLRSPQG